ncbi:MAG: hypothetical protein HQL17_08635, partial [Candidatus Omnitrophica bacterium]|nr:hypothetical protein [Candidatus Omnitrophota bacterium]
MFHKMVMDEFGRIYNSDSELMDSYLSMSAYREQEVELLDKFRAGTRALGPKQSRESVLAPMVTHITKNDSYIVFDGKTLTSQLDDKDMNTLSLDTVKLLLLNADKINPDGKQLLGRFFTQRFEDEAKEGVRVKEMLLWRILEEMIPGFKDIDYDGHLEFIVEAGSYILKRLIKDPSVTRDQILADQPDIPQALYDETMYYLDSSNILKAFSMMGLLPQTYFFAGELMAYASPIKIHYTEEGVRYYDQKIVDQMVPEWRRPTVKADADEDLLVTMARGVRPLTVPEEKWLAHQVRLGNKSAEDVLVGANLLNMIRICTYARHIVRKKMGGIVDIRELYGVGNLALVTVIRAYAESEAFYSVKLSDYLSSRLPGLVYSTAFAEGQKSLQRSLDAPLNGDTDMTLMDVQSVAPVAESQIQEKQLYGNFRQLLLEKFTPTDADIIVLHILGGPSRDSLAEEFAVSRMKAGVYIDEDEALRHVNDLMEAFEGFRDALIAKLGAKKVLEMLYYGKKHREQEDVDNGQAVDKTGGIDLRPGGIPLGISGPGSAVDVPPADFDPAFFTSAAFTGFVPVILDIQPVKDISVFGI